MKYQSLYKGLNLLRLPLQTFKRWKRLEIGVLPASLVITPL